MPKENNQRKHNWFVDCVLKQMQQKSFPTIFWLIYTFHFFTNVKRPLPNKFVQTIKKKTKRQKKRTLPNKFSAILIYLNSKPPRKIQKTVFNTLPVASCIHCPWIALKFPVNPCFRALLAMSRWTLPNCGYVFITCHSRFVWATVTIRHLSFMRPKIDVSWDAIRSRQNFSEKPVHN